MFDELNIESFVIIRQMEKIEFSKTDSLDLITEKLNKVKGYLLELKAKHEKKKSTYKVYLTKIREDIKEFTK